MFKKYAKKFINHFSTNNFVTLNRIEINANRLISNYNIFKNINSNIQIIPVLKSNAYGHGLVQIAEILNNTDCELIAVDGYFEAAKIKDITNHKILVLGYIKPENYKILDIKKCSFVIQEANEIHELAKLNKKVNIHIELNTGMNRLGLNSSELNIYLKTLKKYPKIKLEGIMSHLSDSDNLKDKTFTDMQIKLFDELVEKILKHGFKPKYIHLSQTAGSVYVKSKYANASRIGIGLYGISPIDISNNISHIFNKLMPILELKSTIIKTINLKKGDKVSYNGTFVAKQPMKIGVLPIGYYEGIPRELSNCGRVTTKKYKLIIIGRICMNHLLIDLANTNLKVGDEITIISDNKYFPNSVNMICKKHNLFSYQLIAKLSENIRRIIIY